MIGVISVISVIVLLVKFVGEFSLAFFVCSVDKLFVGCRLLLASVHIVGVNMQRSEKNAEDQLYWEIIRNNNKKQQLAWLHIL